MSTRNEGGFLRDAATGALVVTLTSATVYFVYHGSNADEPRPTADPNALVFWIGSVRPNNGLRTDWWPQSR